VRGEVREAGQEGHQTSPMSNLRQTDSADLECTGGRGLEMQ
jgi:hypothetical protein